MNTTFGAVDVAKLEVLPQVRGGAAQSNMMSGIASTAASVGAGRTRASGEFGFTSTTYGSSTKLHLQIRGVDGRVDDREVEFRGCDPPQRLCVVAALDEPNDGGHGIAADARHCVGDDRRPSTHALRRSVEPSSRLRLATSSRASAIATVTVAAWRSRSWPTLVSCRGCDPRGRTTSSVPTIRSSVAIC